MKLRRNSFLVLFAVLWLFSTVAIYAWRNRAKLVLYANDATLTYKYLNTDFPFVIWDLGEFKTNVDKINSDGMVLLVDRTLFGKYLKVDIDGAREYLINLNYPHTRSGSLGFFLRKLPSKYLSVTVCDGKGVSSDFTSCDITNGMAVNIESGAYKQSIFVVKYTNGDLVISNEFNDMY